MAGMDPSLTDETPHAILTFVTLKRPVHGHPRSIFCGFWKFDIVCPICFVYMTIRISHTVMKKEAIFTFVTFKWPLKVMQGRRSWCIFTKWVQQWTFLFTSTLGLGATVTTLRWIFTFLTLRWPVQSHPRSNVLGILKVRDHDYNLSHRHEARGDYFIFTFVTLKWPLKVNRGQIFLWIFKIIFWLPTSVA